MTLPLELGRIYDAVPDETFHDVPHVNVDGQHHVEFLPVVVRQRVGAHQRHHLVQLIVQLLQILESIREIVKSEGKEGEKVEPRVLVGIELFEMLVKNMW